MTPTQKLESLNGQIRAADRRAYKGPESVALRAEAKALKNLHYHVIGYLMGMFPERPRNRGGWLPSFEDAQAMADAEDAEDGEWGGNLVEGVDYC